MPMPFDQGFRAWLTQLHELALEGQVYSRSCGISLLVGTVLNLINQPEALVGLAPLNLPKALLTYLVPFPVATYGAVTALRRPAGSGDQD